VGIRQILNHHPTNPLLTWPKVLFLFSGSLLTLLQVSRDYLHDPTWRENFSLLAKYNFTFDFQGNPHQLLTAAEIFKVFVIPFSPFLSSPSLPLLPVLPPPTHQLLQANPNIPIVIDHLGTLYLRGEDDKDEALKVWREGLREMANLPQVILSPIGVLSLKDFLPDVDTIFHRLNFLDPHETIYAWICLYCKRREIS
jgi:hypothetical protein